MAQLGDTNKQFNVNSTNDKSQKGCTPSVTDPLKRFPCAVKVAMLIKFPSSVGSVPSKELNDKKRDCIDPRVPTWVGSVPERALSNKSRYVRAPKLKNSVGSAESRKFCDNERSVRDAALPISVGMAPNKSN